MNDKKEEIRKHKVGVYICHCGGNISDYVNVKEVEDAVKDHPGVKLVKTTMFTCSDASQVDMVEDIKENDLDAMVVASCSPKLHLVTFRDVARRAGLNPYNYIQVNIREQSSWAHSDKPSEATVKAIKLVTAGIEKARRFRDLRPIEIEAVNTAVVVGAGISGMRAAIELADMGTQVYLIEKDHFVGGRVVQWGKVFQGDANGGEIAERLFTDIKKRDNITLFTGAQVVAQKGSVGNFEITVKIEPGYVKEELSEEEFASSVEICPIEVPDEFNFGLTKRKAIYKHNHHSFPNRPAIDVEACNKCAKCVEIGNGKIDLEQKAESITIHAGAVLVNTGYDPYEPEKEEFGYGDIQEVVTLQQLERLIELNPESLIWQGKKIRNIAFIYCVGSRQPGGERTYCSRYCCTAAIHSAIKLCDKYKDVKTFHLHKGIRTYGKLEVLYEEASVKGNVFLQFEEGKNPVVQKINGQVEVKLNDILTGNEEIEINPDLVVLVTGMVARENSGLQQVLKIPQGADKFFNEVHMKLRPVETVMDGIFIGGTCQSPKNITETMTSSLAATAKASSLISKGTITLEPNLAIIDKDKCTWCGKCEEICTYGAIEKVESDGKEIARVIDAACKGCGACMPVCPVDAIDLLGYTNSEIEAMIDAIAEEIEIKEKRGVEDKQPETEGMDEDWLIKVEKLSNRSKKILTSLETEPKSIPEISKEVNISTEDVTYLLMSLRKYGYVKDTNDINEDEYYTYALNHESVHS
jgi:heterodisulfide reductase subunit A